MMMMTTSKGGEIGVNNRLMEFDHSSAFGDHESAKNSTAAKNEESQKSI